MQFLLLWGEGEVGKIYITIKVLSDRAEIKSSRSQSTEDLFVRLGIPALMNRGEVFRHVLSTSEVYEHVKWCTSGVSARLWLMCTHQTELPLMLSQEHHNLSWP